ncbi:shikimate kinase [Acholeplasma hippikon]|nr:shikimate kinase [Acholeplasma hippikon]
MKTLLVILGGQAVGKMTVGEEIEKRTNLKLFHNHMTVEIANHFYGFGDDLSEEAKVIQRTHFRDLRDRLRHVVFDNVGRSYLPGMIFTGAMYYDNEEVWNLFLSYVETYKNAAKSIGEDVKVYILELYCDLEERLKRNRSENRMAKKPSKKNVLWSEEQILIQERTKRIIANEDDIKQFNVDEFIKINNTKISAENVAIHVVEKLGLGK